MENLTSLVRDVHRRRELFLAKLTDIESTIMEAVADHDDMLADRDIDAIALGSELATKLFAFTHDMALGFPADSATVQQQVREMLAGLSNLTDKAFPTGDEDDEVWA